jgi:uncharacterized damage-inducible protein DinB
MSKDISSLQTLYKGWDTYQASIVNTIAPLSPEQLAWRPALHLRSAGELASHIADGRIHWFHSFMGEDTTELASLLAAGQPEDTIATNASELIKWLEISWQLVASCLNRWTVADLTHIYHHTEEGKNYAVPRQWVVEHIFAHDLHHGGELALTLGMQGIPIPELGDNFGQPALPLAEPD